MGRLAVLLLPLLLAGCLTSKGNFLPVENASTPLEAGMYYRIEPGDPLPALAGPFRLNLKGKEYSFSTGRDVLKFRLFRLVERKDIYVAQAAPGAKSDNVAILFGPLTKDGFCDYSDNAYPGVGKGGDISAPDELRQWLVSHVDEIVKKTRGVCWVRLTHG